MNKTQLYRFILLIAAGLFLAVQSFSIAHASTYSDVPHEHDGVTCVLNVLSEDHCAPLPQVNSFDLEAFYFVERFDPQCLSTFWASPQNRAPPPRAPPFQS